MGLLGKNTKIEIKKDILINDKDLNIQELKISLGSLPISLEGKILGYSTQTPDVDLKFSGGPADIENIVGLIPSKMLPSDLKNVESKGNLHIAGNLQGKINTANAGQSIQASNFSLTMNLSNGSVRAPQLPKPMTNIGFSVSVDPRKAEVKNFAADFGGSMIRLSATVSDYLKNPIFDFDTKSTLALTDLSALHQDMPAKNLQGSFVANINASGAAKNPMSTVLNGSVVMKEISFDYPDMNYKIEHFNSTLKLASNNVVIQNLGLLINGSDFSGSGRIDNPMAMMNEDKNSLLKFSINASSKNIDADKLMPPPSDDETTELPPSFYKLDGDIKATIAKLTFNKLDMTNAVGNIGLHKGLVTFNPLSVKTFGGIVAMTGNVNLKNKKKPTFDLDTQLTNIAVDKALNYADNVNKLLKLDNSLKANIGLKAKSKGELTQDFRSQHCELGFIWKFLIERCFNSKSSDSKGIFQIF
jgi:AsmA protein